MQIIYKKLGETPLECLEKYRSEMNISSEVKLSYIGRLDPMAEGEMIIIEGEENKDREKYLNFDKEYLAFIKRLYFFSWWRISKSKLF
jgi:tRNA U55 pseudouridine synthase TruB